MPLLLYQRNNEDDPMAHKYDQITVPSLPKGPAKHFPWYKERLKWKYIQPLQQSNILRATRWRFVHGNIDDFRSGAPYVAGNSMINKQVDSSVPLINEPPRASTRVSPDSKTHVTRRNAGKTLYTKLGPRRQKQIERLAKTQAGLMKHPLALYTHLEESLPQELAGNIIGMLDPKLDLSDDKSDSEQLGSGSASLTSLCQDDPDMPLVESQGRADDNSPLKDSIYHMPLKKTAEDEAAELAQLAAQNAVSPSQESRMNAATRDLVQWAKDLGEDNSEIIDDTTVKKLFASDYETKPTVPVPIHVMEQTSIPTELRLASRGYSSRSPTALPSSSFNQVFHHIPQNVFPEYQPNYVKTRYGAWYINPKLWRPRAWNEPMRNPADEWNEKELEARRKSEALDAALATTHGARAFKDYVLLQPNGTAMPKFLKHVNTKNQNKL